MAAKHDHGADRGPGEPGAAPAGQRPGEAGAAPAAEAASRVSCAADASPASVGNGAQEPGRAPSSADDSVASPLAGEEPELDAAVQDELEPEAGARTAEGELSDEEILDRLVARAEKADEYLALAQRTKADFENYRKRAVRETAAAQERGVVKLARELLPAVDNLDRALAAAESASAPEGEQADNGSATLVSGIKLVHADVMAALARVGIEPFSPQGETFDPQHHEAVAQQPVEGAPPGMVVEVYQSGYRLGESVLRPARVVVAG